MMHFHACERDQSLHQVPAVREESHGGAKKRSVGGGGIGSRRGHAEGAAVGGCNLGSMRGGVLETEDERTLPALGAGEVIATRGMQEKGRGGAMAGVQRDEDWKEAGPW